jgi:hypothetical protein
MRQTEVFAIQDLAQGFTFKGQLQYRDMNRDLSRNNFFPKMCLAGRDGPFFQKNLVCVINYFMFVMKIDLLYESILWSPSFSSAAVLSFQPSEHQR